MTQAAYLSEEIWRDNFKSGTIVDCVVRDRDIIYVGVRPNVDSERASMMWDSENPIQMCAVYLDDESDNFAYMLAKGLNKPRLGVALLPLPCGMIVSRNVPNNVYLMGRDVKEHEIIDPATVTIANRIKTLFGYAYSVGGMREIYRRVEEDCWQLLDGLPREGEVENVGFNDLDAFSENDMYAVGGRGDVWHFDGARWSQKGFPSNVQLATVTCAGDGNVYITGEGGSIWVGRDSTWRNVYEGNSTILWNDVIWFENKLWLSSDYRLRIWNGSKLEVPEDSDGEEILMSGHMDARDGLLAIASTDTVMTFDGKEWRVVVAPYD